MEVIKKNWSPLQCGETTQTSHWNGFKKRTRPCSFNANRYDLHSQLLDPGPGVRLWRRGVHMWWLACWTDSNRLGFWANWKLWLILNFWTKACLLQAMFLCHTVQSGLIISRFRTYKIVERLHVGMCDALMWVSLNKVKVSCAELLCAMLTSYQFSV